MGSDSKNERLKAFAILEAVPEFSADAAFLFQIRKLKIKAAAKMRAMSQSNSAATSLDASMRQTSSDRRDESGIVRSVSKPDSFKAIA